MSLNLIGVLPISGFNVGLVTASSSLTVSIEKLSFDISKLQASLQAQVDLNTTYGKPDFSSMSATFTTQMMDPAQLSTLLNPANFVTCAADVNIGLAADLAIIQGQIGSLETVTTSLSAGLNVGGLALWSYAGRAGSFGSSFTAQTRQGYGTVAPTTNVKALVIACEDFNSWATFAATFNAGRSADRQVQTTDEANLRFEGYFSGGQLNTGTASVLGTLDLTLADLKARSSNIEASIQVSLGLNFPDVTQLLSISSDIDFDLAFEALYGVSLDFASDIEGINLQILDIEAEIGTISEALSAGGFAFWSYDGPINALGPSLETELENGVPAGNGADVAAYGIVIACEVPSIWAIFGTIFGAT